MLGDRVVDEERIACLLVNLSWAASLCRAHYAALYRDENMVWSERLGCEVPWYPGCGRPAL